MATGSGNVAIPAARLGARVTGLDLTPELLEVARVRADDAGVSVRWVEGDAEALPFADASFERVTSCFGVIFAPRHELTAGELARVARAGATVAFTAWTPEGMNGQMFRTIGSYMPPPPPELGSPVQWGVEVRPLAVRGQRCGAVVRASYGDFESRFARELGGLQRARARASRHDQGCARAAGPLGGFEGGAAGASIASATRPRMALSKRRRSTC